VTAFEHGAAVIDVGKFDLLAIVSVQNDVAILLFKLLERLIDIKAVVVG